MRVMLSYALTVFVGAFLLFQVQPLIAKYLLPWFGGGPSVWTTCMLFFQVFLLGGYAYSHALTRYLKPRTQAMVHLILLGVALACLPIIPSDSWKPRTSDSPSAAILVLLACNLGVPYFVLSATGPLVQHWSNRSGSRTSPYRLYAWSNLGSLLALVTYPLFFEVHFSRKEQATLWGWGLISYALGCGLCALKTWRPDRLTSQMDQGGGTGNYHAAASKVQSRPVGAWQPLLWLLWPACASVLLLATTNKLCLDVAAFPFLWVVPLALYLLSFTICFGSPSWYLRLPFTLALGLAIDCICWAMFRGASWPFWAQVCAYSGGLFVCCLVCHGELFRLRPGPESLTEFYLWVAGGGAVGGLFVSLVAPAIFTNYYELHWGLALCGLLVVSVRTIEGFPRLRVAQAAQPKPVQAIARASSWGGRDWGRLGLALLWLAFFALITSLCLQARRSGSEIVRKSRNFYGVVTVFEHRKGEPNGHHFLLQHGRITHGLQFVERQLKSWPTTYYGPDSGIGLAFNALPSEPRRIGVIGLGTGTIAAYGRAGDYFHFYEIDPQVKDVATSRFSFLAGSGAQWEVTIGDARLSLENEAPQGFDLLALDAFSSDSIPVHLLTKQAFEDYLQHIRPNGIIAVHTSNHLLDLEPVVAGLADQFGLKIAVIDHDANPEQWWIYSSTWILLTRDEQVLRRPSICAVAKSGSAPRRTVPLWTDDFTSVFQILR